MQEEKQFIDNGMTLVDFFHLIIKNLILIITITVATTVIGVIYTFNIAKPKYTAESFLIVQVMNGEDSTSTKDYDVNMTFNLMQPVSEFLQQDLIIERVIEDMNLDITPKQFRSNLAVNYSNRSFFITIKYEAGNPILARDIVNSLVDIAISTANNEYPVISNTIFSMGAAKDGIYTSPNKVLNIAISIILGGIIGIVTVLLIEAFHTTIRSKKELELLLPEYQIIGIIPDIVSEGE